MSNSKNTSPASPLVLTMLFLLPSNELLARVTAVTLAELVKESSTIVYGHLIRAGGTSLETTAWVPFEASQVIKGVASLRERPIRLCGSPPPMRDYPDISKWTGYEVILFLSPREGAGCFELSHSYVSIVEVHDAQVSTVEIVDEPKALPIESFLAKVRALVSKHARSDKPAKSTTR